MGSPPQRNSYEVSALVAALGRRGLVERLRLVCLGYHVTLEEVLSRARHRQVVRGRDACIMRLCSLGLSGPEIAKLLGMDPSSIVVARARYRERDNGRLAS